MLQVITLCICMCLLRADVFAQVDTATINKWNTESFAKLKSDPRQARSLAEQALSASQQINYNKGLSDAYMRIGLLFKNAGEPDSAIGYYHKSLRYRKVMGDKDLIARACSNIGNLYHNTGRFDSAIYYHLKSVSLAEQIADTVGLLKYLNSTAVAYQKYGALGKAKVFYTRSLQLADMTGAVKESARARSNLASVYVDSGAYRLALQTLSPLFDQMDEGREDIMANAYNNAGLSYLYLDKPDSAKLAFTRSLALYGDIVSDDVATVLSNLGLLAVHDGNMQAAIDYFERSNAMAAQLHVFTLLATNHTELGKLYHAQGRHNEAMDAWFKAMSYRDSVAYLRQIEMVEDASAKYEAEKKDAAIRALELEQEIIAIDRDKKQQQRNVVIVLALFILLLTALLFNRKALQRKIEYQQKLTDDRTRISADLHDDIGSALSSISMYSELAKERFATSDKSEIQAYMEEIAGTSGELLDHMGDLVWAVNPANDSMEKMLSRIQTFGSRLCAPRQIAFVFTYPEVLEQMAFDMEVRHCVYMIIKEAIHNAVKYAEAGSVQVTMELRDKYLYISVTDNGKGFDTGMEYEGNGLRNMKRRAEQIGAELEFYSRPFQETGLTMKYAFAHRRMW